VESFNAKLRDEFLSAEVFHALATQFSLPHGVWTGIIAHP
jgi:hypothetical protein